MKVLFIGTLPDPVTGQSLACKVFLDELEKHHDVDVINLSKSGFKQGVDSLGRVLAVLGIVFQAWRKQRSTDVIYLTVAESRAGNLKDLLIYLVSFRRLSRLVIHLHGGAGLRGIMLGPKGLTRRLNEFLLRRSGGAIVLGQRHVEIYQHTLPRDRIHIVPNFAEDYLFLDDDAIARKFADVRPMKILFLSNLLPGKGYIELVDAFLALDEGAKAAVSIDLAGGFESPAQERELLDRIAGVPQIRYHGTVHGERKRQLFEQAHIFCLPTYYPYEGQPISILEAYASGCAVITTDHSGVFDVFTPGVNGFEVEKRSAASVKTAIETALANPQRVHEMAMTNASNARVNYRTTTYQARLMRVIDLIGSGEREIA
jgi:glycosyltransferase involved in cell wall biosynthesis